MKTHHGRRKRFILISDLSTGARHKGKHHSGERWLPPRSASQVILQRNFFQTRQLPLVYNQTSVVPPRVLLPCLQHGPPLPERVSRARMKTNVLDSLPGLGHLFFSTFYRLIFKPGHHSVVKVSVGPRRCFCFWLNSEKKKIGRKEGMSG